MQDVPEGLVKAVLDDEQIDSLEDSDVGPLMGEMLKDYKAPHLELGFAWYFKSWALAVVLATKVVFNAKPQVYSSEIQPSFGLPKQPASGKKWLLENGQLERFSSYKAKKPQAPSSGSYLT